MKISDITSENEKLYYCCLEEWSEEMNEAGDYKQRWYERMKCKGVKVKFALDENNIIGGMIQYIPIEHTGFEGENLYVVLCIWVHGYNKGRGNYRKRGMGSALLKAAEEDSRQLGAKGMVTWGLLIPVFMRASWFKQKGYKVADKNGLMRLLWKPFNENAIPPRFIKQKKKPEKGVEKVNITMFRNDWCPAQNIAYERARRASEDFQDKITIREYDTLDRGIVKEWGITDGLFIDGKKIRIGPPPSYKKIRKKIARSVNKKK
ncbi:MAG: GNAT family N-acetyltransferase [Bacteroidales bacterium]|jgi:N-acetylglutamate synthase-like GNAT family acetyltransferase|nr:GNAT family N-acetyltransferase [Bacteroidales bacterium]